MPEASAQYLHVSPTRYVAYFIVAFLLLSVLELRVERRTDWGLQRIDELWHDNRILLRQEPEDVDLHGLAQRLAVRPEDLLTAQYVVEAYLNNLDRERRDPWTRLIAIEGEEFRVFIGLRYFLNLFIAGLLSLMLYFRQRGLLAEELIDYQGTKFARVNNQLETKMLESTRIIDKLNKLQDKLVEAEKLASIGQLSATLAHEIRNPLSIMKSSTEIVQDDLQTGSPSESALNLIRDEIARLDRIITDLLNFARPKEPRLERIWVKQLVRHWLPPVVEELEKHKIQLVPQFENVDGEVLIDPDQLYQVFLNVMWNARDALQGHANPHVFARLEDGGDEYIKLVVQDTGPGMLPEVVKQMKEPFFTTKTQGTGLGIPVSIQLVEGMGGKLEVESVVEFGTTVSLFLPRAGARRRRSSSSSDALFLPAADPEPRRHKEEELHKDPMKDFVS